MSQDEASLRCGYTRAIFGQIENGRINIPQARIEHMVKSLGYTMQDFNTLMKAEVLRDEIIADCSVLLHKLDDQKLASVRTVIMSLGGI
jgi:transcriptional regulator with XRE-family HTH domain